MNQQRKRKFRVRFEVNEGLTLDFWAKDKEDAFEIASEAESDGLITYSPMWEVIQVDEIMEEDERFDPINQL